MQRETKYYVDNISKVKSVDDFVNNDRLFDYAMKAFGLSDMSYAKAFMKKVLEGGVSDPNSLANQLADKRYAEFVVNFNFAAHGTSTTVFNNTRQATAANYAKQAAINGVDMASVKTETDYYLANIGNVKSIDDLMANDRLYNYAMAAYGIDPTVTSKDTIRQVLQGGVSDPGSFANTSKDPRYVAFATAFNFEQYGEQTTTYSASPQPVVDDYMRQTLEENAGQQDEGRAPGALFPAHGAATHQLVSGSRRQGAGAGGPHCSRLAEFLRFGRYRQAGRSSSNRSSTSRTSPTPTKLGAFLQRFTSLYQLQQPQLHCAVLSDRLLFSQPTEYGISTDLLLTLQKFRD